MFIDWINLLLINLFTVCIPDRGHGEQQIRARFFPFAIVWPLQNLSTMQNKAGCFEFHLQVSCDLKLSFPSSPRVLLHQFASWACQPVLRESRGQGRCVLFSARFLSSEHPGWVRASFTPPPQCGNVLPWLHWGLTKLRQTFGEI